MNFLQQDFFCKLSQSFPSVKQENIQLTSLQILDATWFLKIGITLTTFQFIRSFFLKIRNCTFDFFTDSHTDIPWNKWICTLLLAISLSFSVFLPYNHNPYMFFVSLHNENSVSPAIPSFSSNVLKWQEE